MTSVRLLREGGVMASRTAALLIRAVRPAKAELCDRDLLRRFADDDDQPAFAVVVVRHSAMVLGVCTRVLHSRADAEDACQAVFLVLAKKAGSGCRWQASVANWLYATARKVAANARWRPPAAPAGKGLPRCPNWCRRHPPWTR